jgi:pheromone shutdown protein TraB
MTEPAESSRDLPPQGGGEGSVTVVGTAHVSQDSVDEVEATIESHRPDVVAVELDEGRYKQMKGEAPEDLDASDMLRGNTVFQFLAYWMLSYVQTRLGDRFDISPGADMLAGVETAERLGLGVALVDREIQTTVQRFWARLTLKEKLVLVGSLLAEFDDPRVVGTGLGMAIGLVVGVAAESIAGPVLLPAGAWAGGTLPTIPLLGGLAIAAADFLIIALGIGLVVGIPIAVLLTSLGGDEDLEEFDMSDLTDGDVVTAMMEEFRRFSPGGAEALIDERDAYIAHRLVALREAGYDVVAVVGAGHREGIERYLADPASLPAMESLVGQEESGRFSVYKLIGYAITLAFLAFFVLLALGGASQQWLLELFAAWFVVNAVCAGGLALVAGARWTSAAVGGGIAWMTSVNPLLAPGWFAGYVELRYQDVSVADIATLNEILDDQELPILELVAQMREVPLFRLIMVVALTNVGSMIASLIVFPAILPWLSAPIGGVEAMGGLLVEGARTGADVVWSAVGG